MGLSTVMSSTILFYTFLVAIAFFISVSLTVFDIFGEAAYATLYTRRDEIRFEALSYDNNTASPPAVIEVNITNIGDTVIFDYTRMDVIVEYTELASKRVEYVRFGGEYTITSRFVPGWYIDGFYDVTGGFQDYTNANPIAWKPSTTMNMVIVIDGLPDPVSKVSITIVTPGGGREYFEFTW